MQRALNVSSRSANHCTTRTRFSNILPSHRRAQHGGFALDIGKLRFDRVGIPLPTFVENR